MSVPVSHYSVSYSSLLCVCTGALSIILIAIQLFNNLMSQKKNHLRLSYWMYTMNIAIVNTYSCQASMSACTFSGRESASNVSAMPVSQWVDMQSVCRCAGGRAGRPYSSRELFFFSCFLSEHFKEHGKNACEVLQLPQLQFFFTQHKTLEWVSLSDVTLSQCDVATEADTRLRDVFALNLLRHPSCTGKPSSYQILRSLERKKEYWRKCWMRATASEDTTSG